ncbi:MAG: Gfo/Idh/MocA family oxidoreductase [Micropruina sp.]
MTEQIRWGIAGPGRMAAAIVSAFDQVPNGRLVAVGSRSEERAEAFALAHGLPRAHGSYEELITDPDVDALYLATPHTQHAAIALAAIEAGKPLLIEKSFTASVADTEAIISAARARGVFVMEAMWTRFLPAVAHLRSVIAAGEIGEVRGCHGDLTAFRGYDPHDRLFDPALGGGAVLDLGVYVLSFAQHILGVPDVVHAVGGTYESGVEGEFSAVLGYADGRSASLTAAFTAYGPGRMMIVGTEGWIDVHPRFHRAPSLTIWRGKEPEELTFDSGYHYEIAHVGDCLAQGLIESPIMPLADTLAVQRLMDEVLRQVRR